MARNVEFALLGGGPAGDRIYQPDALDSFAGSAETGVEMRTATKWFAPQGPAGEAVLKAFILQVVHQFGFVLEGTPVADGATLHGLVRQYSRTPTGAGPQRVSLRFPVGRFQANGAYSTGLRATSFGLLVVARSPGAPLHLDTVTYEAIPLHQARGRRVNE